MKPLKTKQLADRLNLATATVRLWTMPDQYGKFLSERARGERGGTGHTRAFNEQDARVLGYVAYLKAQNLDHESIIATLEDMEGKYDDLPPLPAGRPGSEPIAMIPSEAAMGRVEEIRARYMREITTLEERIDELAEQLDQERAGRRDDMERFLREQSELYEQIGMLKGELKALRGGKD